MKEDSNLILALCFSITLLLAFIATGQQIKSLESKDKNLNLEESQIRTPVTIEPNPTPQPDRTPQSNDKGDLDSEELAIIKNGDYLLALVTKNTTLENYQPMDLVKIPTYMLAREGNRYLRKEAFNQLEKMWEDAQAEGVRILIVSTFRSYETQKNIFSRNASIHGEVEANRFSARPGQSEHQLGTTVDFVSHREEALTDSFARTPSGKWLMQNSYKYGFVMSYPEEKEYITGYVFEPWHYRYIGVEAAKEWKESELTLTEFLKRKPQEFK